MDKKPDISKIILLKKLYSKQMRKKQEYDNVSAGLAVFVAAIEQKEFNSQQKLSEFLGCNKAHTSRTLAKLQELGLIEPLTSRNMPIRLTEKGKEYAVTSKNKKEGFCLSLMNGVSEDEMKIFEKVLDKIINNAIILTEQGVWYGKRTSTYWCK